MSEWLSWLYNELLGCNPNKFRTRSHGLLLDVDLNIKFWKSIEKQPTLMAKHKGPNIKVKKDHALLIFGSFAGNFTLLKGCVGDLL